MFVESANLFVKSSPNHEACGSYGGHFASTGKRARIAVTIRHLAHDMIGSAPATKRNSSVLNRPVRKQQQRADGSNVRLLQVIKKLIDPVRRKDLDVVI